jgi:hypothetical protein
MSAALPTMASTFASRLWVIAPMAVILLVLFGGPYLLGKKARKRQGPRELLTEEALRRVAISDPAYEPQALKEAARALITKVASAWDDRDKLAELVGPQLLEERVAKIDELASQGKRPMYWLKIVNVRLVGLNYGGSDAENRVVVSLQCYRDHYTQPVGDPKPPRNVHNYSNPAAGIVRNTGHFELWILGRRDGRWMVDGYWPTYSNTSKRIYTDVGKRLMDEPIVVGSETMTVPPRGGR